MATVMTVVLPSSAANAAIALCPGAAFTQRQVYDFTGSASTAVQESLRHDPADNLHIVADHPDVTFDGVAALFHGNGILQLDGSNFNPGTRSWTMCIRWAWGATDPDGYNLMNLGDNPGTNNLKGFGKMMPGYGRADGVGGVFTQLSTHGSSQQINHTSVFAYNASTHRACVYLDGTKDDCADVNLGNVDLSNQPLAVGGKFERSPGLVGTEDIGHWRVFQVQLTSA